MDVNNVTLQSNQILTLYATIRGFTGHEMVDGFDIVHMNGRIYDNMIGRFLQADPIVQDPSNTQNFNRYVYVWNNPLAYTDPSGYMSQMWRQIIAIVIVVVAVITQQYWALKGAAAFWVGVAAGFASGYVSSGTLQGGLYGAFSAGVFFGIGQAFAGVAGASGTGVFGSGLSAGMYGMKVLAHGLAGGVMSVLQGGKFGHGFASAGATQAFAPGIDRIPGGPGARIAASALLGGTTSVISGGKFANGAITAAFSRAFNEEMPHKQKPTEAKIKYALKVKAGKIMNIALEQNGIKISRESELTGAKLEIGLDGKGSLDIPLLGKFGFDAGDGAIGDIEKYSKSIKLGKLSFSFGVNKNGILSTSATLSTGKMPGPLKFLDSSVGYELEGNPYEMIRQSNIGRAIENYPQRVENCTNVGTPAACGH